MNKQPLAAALAVALLGSMMLAMSQPQAEVQCSLAPAFVGVSLDISSWALGIVGEGETIYSAPGSGDLVVTNSGTIDADIDVMGSDVLDASDALAWILVEPPNVIGTDECVMYAMIDGTPVQYGKVATANIAMALGAGLSVNTGNAFKSPATITKEGTHFVITYIASAS